MKGGFRIALRNLGRNRRRNAATGTAIAVGFAALVLLGGYIIRAESFLSAVAVYLQHSGHVAVYKTHGVERYRSHPRQYSLTAEEQRVISEATEKDTEVEFAARYLNGTGLAGNGCKTVPFIARGLEPIADRFTRSHPRVVAAIPEASKPLRGRDLAAVDEKLGPVSLSSGLAKLLGKRDLLVGNDPAPPDGILDCEAAGVQGRIAKDTNVQLVGVTFDGSFSAIDGTLVGVHTTGSADTEDNSLYAPLALLQRLYDTDSVTYVALYLHDAKGAKRYAASLQEKLRARGLDVEALSFEDDRINQFYTGTMGFLAVLSAFIYVIVFTVIVLSIVNSMTMTILDRSREIGSFRSIGFTRGQLLGLFVREGLVLSVISIGAGTVLAFAAAHFINGANIRYSPPGIPGDIHFMVLPNALLSVGLSVVMLMLAVLAVAFAVWGRVRRPIVELNSALSA